MICKIHLVVDLLMSEYSMFLCMVIIIRLDILMHDPKEHEQPCYVCCLHTRYKDLDIYHFTDFSCFDALVINQQDRNKQTQDSLLGAQLEVNKSQIFSNINRSQRFFSGVAGSKEITFIFARWPETQLPKDASAPFLLNVLAAVR